MDIEREYYRYSTGKTYAVHFAEEVLKSAEKGMYELSGPEENVVNIYFRKGSYHLRVFESFRSALIDAGWVLVSEGGFGELEIDNEFVIQPNRYVRFSRPLK